MSSRNPTIEQIRARRRGAYGGTWAIDPTTAADPATQQHAQFIANAPTDIDYLLAEIDRLTAATTEETS